MTLSTIIISYNTADLTTQAVQSVLDNYEQDHISGEVIVVDNNSSDSSVQQIQKTFGKKVQIIENKKNVGFAGANNQAMKIAKGEYFFLLNSDTILKPHAIQNLLKQFEKYPDQDTSELRSTPKLIDRLGIVTGKLLNQDGTIQPQGGALPSLLTIKLWWLWPFAFSIPFLPPRWQYHVEDSSYFDKDQVMGWVGGTAMMIRRELVSQIGMLDDNIFMYAEDVEFCWRARKHHWDILYTPTADITHFGSASSSKSNSIISEIKGLLYVTAKHMGSWQYQAIRFTLLIGALLRYVLFGIILSDAKKKQAYQEIITIINKTK